jgi:hypothetical protein
MDDHSVSPAPHAAGSPTHTSYSTSLPVPRNLSVGILAPTFLSNVSTQENINNNATGNDQALVKVAFAHHQGTHTGPIIHTPSMGYQSNAVVTQASSHMLSHQPNRKSPPICLLQPTTISKTNHHGLAHDVIYHTAIASTTTSPSKLQLQSPALTLASGSSSNNKRAFCYGTSLPPEPMLPAA